MVVNSMSYAKYESYKDSGVDWLGEIPSDWELLKVKNIFRLVMKFAPKNNDCELLSVYTDIGVKPRKELEERGNRATTTDGYLIVEKGDIVVNKLLAWMGAIGLSDYDGVTSPAYDILKPKIPIEGIFYHLLFRSPQCTSELRRYSRGIMDMRLRLYFDKFGDVVVPYPNIEVQKKIVSFLAKKTTQIDQAIALKQQQIEKLNEYKQIVIQNAVTKGLNPNAPMKDSGVEWIGDIPEHWEVKKLKFLGKCIIGLTYSPNDISDKENGTLVLRSSNLKNGHFYYSEDANVYVQTKIPNKLILKKDDILICSRNGSRDLIGKCAIATEKDIGNSFGAFTTVFRSELNPYLYFIFNSGIFKMLAGSFLTSTINQLTTGNLNTMQMPIPPNKERQEIISYLTDFNEKIANAIESYQTQIHRLKEYKNILINQAVTGKIKI